MSNPATVQSYKLSPPQSALICIFWKDTISERSPTKLSPEIVKQFCFFFVPGVRRQGCRCFFLSESDKGSTSATRKTILTLLIFIQTSRAKRKLWSFKDLTSLYELGMVVVVGGEGGRQRNGVPSILLPFHIASSNMSCAWHYPLPAASLSHFERLMEQLDPSNVTPPPPSCAVQSWGSVSHFACLQPEATFCFLASDPRVSWLFIHSNHRVCTLHAPQISPINFLLLCCLLNWIYSPQTD